MRGLLQAAGLIHDQLLLRMRAGAVNVVFAPKVVAAIHMHHCNARGVTETMILFSSVAATLGSSGQANYAAANAALNSLSYCRSGCGLAVSSFQPLNVSTQGMAKAANDIGRNRRL